MTKQNSSDFFLCPGMLVEKTQWMPEIFLLSNMISHWACSLLRTCHVLFLYNEHTQSLTQCQQSISWKTWFDTNFAGSLRTLYSTLCWLSVLYYSLCQMLFYIYLVKKIYHILNKLCKLDVWQEVNQGKHYRTRLWYFSPALFFRHTCIILQSMVFFGTCTGIN